MKQMFLLFSHKLTKIQEDDAKKNLNIDKFISLPEKLQFYWSNVDPISYDEDNFNEIMKFVEGNANEGDYILIQGEWGFVHNAVLYCKKINLIPVYSTTTREVKEIYKEDGNVEKISLFRHFIYKLY